jgi:putative membrane protein
MKERTAMVDLSTLLTVPVLADWDGPGWWIVFVPLGWLLVIATLVLLFRFVIFRRAGSAAGWGCGPAGRGPEGRLSAADLLERRFAEGELSADEYRERRAVLGERQQPGDQP